MSLLLVAGSPSERSRSGALLESVGARLRHHLGEHAGIEWLSVRDLSPHALLHAEASHPNVAQALIQVRRARVVVIATPVYKAAYSGLLKVFLDLLPQDGLKGKTVLPLATGGSPHHMLALDYALRPVLQSLGAAQVLTGIYATDAQVVLHPGGGHALQPDVAQRINEAVLGLIDPPSPPLRHLLPADPTPIDPAEPWRCRA